MGVELIGRATAVVAGQTLELVMDNGAWLAVEPVTGKAFLKITAEYIAAALGKGLSEVDVREIDNVPVHLEDVPLGLAQPLLFGALRAKHPDISYDECGALIRGGGLGVMIPLYNAVIGSLNFASPDTGEAKPAAAPAE